MKISDKRKQEMLDAAYLRLDALKDEILNTDFRGVSVGDATAASLTTRMLEYFNTQAIVKVYPELIWRTLFSINTDCPAGATTMTYHIWNESGVAEWYSAGKAVPTVEVGRVPVTIRFDPIVNQYPVTDFETLSANYAGEALAQRKGEAARASMERKVDELVFFGDAAAGRAGLYDHPNITAGNFTTGGHSGATAANIIIDYKAILSLIWTAASGNNGLKGKKVYALCPPAEWRILNTMEGNANTLETIEQVLLKQDSMYGGSIECPKLAETAGGGGDAVIFMPLDPEFVDVKIAQDFTPGQVQREIFETRQPFSMIFGTLHVKYPFACYQAENTLV